MKHERAIQPIDLPARAIHSIADAKGTQLTVTKGVVWVTQANDNRDMILSRGESFIIDRDGLTVAYALKDAALIAGPAGHVTAADFATRSNSPHAAGCL